MFPAQFINGDWYIDTSNNSYRIEADWCDDYLDISRVQVADEDGDYFDVNLDSDLEFDIRESIYAASDKLRSESEFDYIEGGVYER